MTAYVHPSVQVGSGFLPSPFCVIDENVVIGDNVTVGSFVHIFPGARIGSGTTISDGAMVGKPPKLANSSTAKRGDLDGVVLGSGCAWAPTRS